MCMQAPVRDCAISGSLHGALRTTRIVRVLNKFCTRSEQIIQSISDISRYYRGLNHYNAWNFKTIILKKMKKYTYLQVC